jgi:N2227-like protein
MVSLDTLLFSHLSSHSPLSSHYISSHLYTPLLSHLPSPLLSYHTLYTHVIPHFSPPTLLLFLLSSSSSSSSPHTQTHAHTHTHTYILTHHKHTHTHTCTHTHTHTHTHTNTHTHTGCGLGRLPLEIAAQGYSCQGNEYSAYVTLCYTCPVLCCVMIWFVMLCDMKCWVMLHYHISLLICYFT